MKYIDVETDEASKATEQRNHSYSGHWARDGSWDFVIHEYVHEAFIAIAARYDEQQSSAIR